MHCFHLPVLCLAVFTTPALISAALLDTDYPFQAPGPYDLRSVCPALNTLCNHGLLPRSGRDIDLPTLTVAVQIGFNMDREFMLGAVRPVLNFSTTGIPDTFHISDIANLEHDGSMSRQDAFFGSPLGFNSGAWARTLQSWSDVEIIDFATAGKELKERFDFGLANNPVFNGAKALGPSLLQYSLLLSSFGDTVVGNANKSIVEYWFQNERFPLHLGWQPSPTPLTRPANQVQGANISAVFHDLGGRLNVSMLAQQREPCGQ